MEANAEDAYAIADGRMLLRELFKMYGQPSRQDLPLERVEEGMSF